MVSDEGTGKRAALYVRVSTDEQTTANQDAALRQLAKHLGLKIVKTYADDGVSGTRRDRKGLAAMLEAAHRREFDVLLVWALDRLSREGIRRMLEYLERLQKAGVRVLSHQESWLQTTDPGVGDLLVSVFAWIAKRESVTRGERTKAGMKRAKDRGTRTGKPIGRPPLPAATAEKIKEALRRGAGIRDTARQCGVSHGTVERMFDRTRGLRKVWARQQQEQGRKTKKEAKREAQAS